jgi:hypothetical protein
MLTKKNRKNPFFGAKTQYVVLLYDYQYHLYNYLI